MLKFVLQCVYVMLPAIIANMAPVLFRGHFKKLAIPIDLGKTYKGKRILGDNKTLRGYIVGILSSIAVIYIQRWLYDYPFFRNLSFVDYNSYNMLLLGFLVGFGVLFGDTVESFIKRRLNIAPGKPFAPWDQVDSVIGALIFVYPAYQFSPSQIVTIIALALLLSFALSYIGFWLGVRKKNEVDLI